MFRTKQTQSIEHAQIILAGKSYPLRLRRHPRAQSMKLRYDAIGMEISLTVPVSMRMATALSLAIQYEDWLLAEIENAVSPVELHSGATLALEGHQREIVWRQDYPRRPRLDGGTIRVGGDKSSLEKRLLRWLKEQARISFAEDLAHYCERAGKALPQLTIGDARTRWGSCSTSGGIRMNWRLVMAPVEVRRSVVAHEVAHLTHMNHSARFYDHLDKLFEGDRKAADIWLKQNGAGLRAIGIGKSVGEKATQSM